MTESKSTLMFSKTIEYALRAVVYLAVNSDEDHKVNISELSEAIDSPKSFTAKIMQQLTRDNVLIQSSTGPSGGFYLPPAARQKTIWNVLQLLDADDIVSGCILGLRGCSERNPCPLHNEYAKIRPQLRSMFEHKTINDLAREMGKPRVVIGNAKRK